MSVYLDASALVKRYVAEPGSELVRELMAQDGPWIACRVAYVEVGRALRLASGDAPAKAFAREWPAFAVVETDQALCERAARLSVARGLRSLDALHLASALLLDDGALVLATWDRRLHSAAAAEGLAVAPERLD